MPSPFPPIADYAFLSDCHTGALVAPDGTIDWLCVPRFDAPSVFGTLLDRQAGAFRFAPFGINVPTHRAYEPGTNTLLTTWRTPGGWMLVRDALTLPGHGAAWTSSHSAYRRPPARLRRGTPPHVRVATCIEGEVEIELTCEPVFDYGRVPAEWSITDDGHSADASGAGVTIRLRTDMAVGCEGDRVRAGHTLRQGEQVFCSLTWSDGLVAPGNVGEANDHLATTTRFWHDWLGRARIPDHRWRQSMTRSALTIKGLTYMPTGATVAALTTSLPETPRGARNWDYRYTWLRDSTFTLQALHYLNLDWEAEEFIQFVADLETNDDGALQIMYGIDGRRDLTESLREDLSGYAGARPVRLGNGAFDQRQERCVRRSARRDSAAQPPQRTAAPASVAARAGPGTLCDEGVAAARSGNLGGERQATALRVVQAHVLGGDGSRREARRVGWRPRARVRLAGDSGGDQG